MCCVKSREAHGKAKLTGACIQPACASNRNTCRILARLRRRGGGAGRMIDPRIDANSFSVNCTGDACRGDVILFTERVFGGGMYKNRKPLGTRRIAGLILKDSYGAEKQQHTFTIRVIASDGYAPLETGVSIMRKGRNVYRNGTRRKLWDDENARRRILENKHERGSIARRMRTDRKGRQGEGPPPALLTP